MKNRFIIKNKIIKTFIICFIVGLILSVLFYLSLDKTEIKLLVDTIKNNSILYKTSNNMINHLKILSVIIILNFLYIGIPLYIGLLISESFKIFLRLIILYKAFKIKGVIYGVIYALINNGIYIVFLLVIFKKLIKIFKIIYKYKFKKENINYSTLYYYFINTIIVLVLIFISDMLIYFYGSKLLYIFIRLCKI